MRYSVVVPIFNDGCLAEALCIEINSIFSAYLGKTSIVDDIEMIFVNDGSGDDSLRRLLDIKNKFNFVKVIDLSRNFGQHIATTCGFQSSSGDLVLRMNVDMQDPPSEIPKLLRKQEEGHYDLVVGTYEVRKSPWSNRVSSYLYYKAFRLLTGLDAPTNSAPLRVMSRQFICAYNRLTEKSRFPQGLDQWLGFKHCHVKIAHQKRADKKSSYTFWSRLRLAVNGMLYFSDRPLQIIASGGFLLAFLGIFMAVYFVINRLMGGDYLPGYTSLVSIALIAFGIQIGCIGVVGLYIGKIFREVQGRPLYIIRNQY